MKMKASELRVGNWYLDNGEYKKVMPYLLIDLWYSEEITWVQPIPISQKILEAVGFEKEFDGNYFSLPEELCKDGWNKSFIYYLPYCDLNIYVSSIKIKYLHQLQNLYFALTHQELNINL